MNLPIVDADQLDDLEGQATVLRNTLRNRRIAIKLRNNDGTPEEADAFTRKAEELSSP